MTDTLPLLALANAPVAVPEPSEAALRFYHSGLILWWVGQLFVLAVPAVLLLSGTSRRMRNLAERKGRPLFVTAGLYGVIYVAIYTLIALPLGFYAGYLRPHMYGLATEGYTVAHWFADEGKELAIAAALAFFVVGLIYVAIRKWPRAWPLAATVAYFPLSYALMYLAPIVVDPMFDKYGPMKDRALEAKIRALAARAGIEGGRIYEAEKSKRTNAINAYVKGFLGSKRIVLYDTLIAGLTEQEVLFVMGHEMGHYALGHVSRTIALGAIGVLALTLGLRWAGTAAISRFGHRLGASRLDDVAAFPLLLILGNLFVLAASPIGLAYSRHQEHEADRFALELTRQNHAGATAFVAMQSHNLSNPRPGQLSVLWRSTHPTLAERIEFCNIYRPWETGEPRRYEALFRDP